MNKNIKLNLEKYKEPILYGALILIVIIVCFYKLNPVISDYSLTKQQLNQTKQELHNLQARLKATKNRYEEQTMVHKVSASKKIYVPIEIGLDSDAVFYDQNNDIIEMAQLNGVKIKSIEYLNSPEDDNFLKRESGKYMVNELTMQLVADYLNFKNFLKSLYKYPYYTHIQSIEITPYKNNPKIIIVKFVIRLYAFSQPQNEIPEELR